MSALLVEPMGDAAAWSAVEPDGVTPSAELAMHDEQVIVGYGTDGHSGRVTGTPLAGGHALRRTIPAADLRAFAELRLSLRASRAAGSGGTPCFLELRLGSAAMSLVDPANTWHRLLPVSRVNQWETVRLSLDDLPGAVRGAVTQVQLRCVAADASFTAYLDDVIAVRPQMLADADRAFEARLAGIVVDGAPAPARVRASGQAPPAPAIDIVHFDVRYAAQRVRDQRLLRDFTEDGARLVSLGDPYDIDYAVTPVAANRGVQAALLEAVVDRLAAVDELTVDGERLPAELFWVRGRDRIGGAAGEAPVLFYRVGVHKPVATAGADVHEVRELRVQADHLEAR